MSTDYAHTRDARERREANAHALAAAALNAGLTRADLAIGARNRVRIWKAAGLTRSPSYETWDHALNRLDDLTRARGVDRSKPVGRRCSVPSCEARDTHLYPCGTRCDRHRP